MIAVGDSGSPAVHSDELDDCGRPLPMQSVPASDFITQVDNSWKKVTTHVQPRIDRLGYGAAALLSKVHISSWYDEGPPSVVPGVALLLLIAYGCCVGIALAFRTFGAFVAWEEGVVICALVFVWVISMTRMRTFIACEYSRAKMTNRPDHRVMYTLAAYAQSKPAVALQILVVLVRLWVRVMAFGISPLLYIETACEITVVIIAILIGVGTVLTAREEVEKKFILYEDARDKMSQP